MPYDDANTLRAQFIIWRQGGRLVDFVANIQELTLDGWVSLERFDCCHGHCHHHPLNDELPPLSISRLDTVEDVKRAFVEVERLVDERVRIIRS